MEILRKQAAIALCFHNSAVVALSRSSSPTATTAVSGLSCNSRQCRPPLLVLPKITPAPQRLALASPLEWKQIHCGHRSSSVGDGLARVYHHALQVACFQGGRRICRAESPWNLAGIHPAPICIRTGAFRERFKLVCRVVYVMKCSSPRWPVPKSSLNGGFSSQAGDVDLELALFSFMQQSSKPDSFPTRQDLISAGRLDLAMAIDQEGGWLAAGWDEVATSSSGFSGENGGKNGKGCAAAGKEKGRPRKRSTRKLKARSVKRSSTGRNSSLMPTVEIDERTYEFGGRVNGTHVVREVVNAVDHKDGRKKDKERSMLDGGGELFEDLSTMERADLAFEAYAVDDTKTTRRPSDDDLRVLERLDSLFRVTEELKLKRPQQGYTWDKYPARNGSVNATIKTATPNNSVIENCRQTETNDQVPAEYSLPCGTDAFVVVGAPAQRRRGPRKKGRPKAANSEREGELNGASDWIHQISDKREKWMLAARSTGEESFAESLAVDSKSTESRLHTLAAKLGATRAELQSLSEELWKTGNADADHEERDEALSEFIDAEDALEFRENAIMHARNELNSTLAQVAAVEGNLKVEIMEARKVLEEKNREVERTRSLSQHLRTARIVWPNPANEVYLTGSFNGWNSQVKMEKSSAGVFTCSLPLYPGKYEIKFVVDGSWRVDTRRPIVYVGGFENNVLTISPL